MSQEIRIYVPDAVGEDMLEYVKRRLAQECGGFTAYSADGGWINGDNELIEEPVTVVSAVSDAPRPQATSVARGLATELESETNEDAVLWQITHSNHGIVANSD